MEGKKVHRNFKLPSVSREAVFRVLRGNNSDAPLTDCHWKFRLYRLNRLWYNNRVDGKGDVVDFYVVRKIVETDAFTDYSGYIEIPDQGGVYKRKKNASQSFPSVYEADVKAEYLTQMPFHYRFAADGTQLLDESFANKDEYSDE